VLSSLTEDADSADTCLVMRVTRALGLWAIAACTGAALWLPASALAAATASQSFSSPGEHPFVVPAGVTSLQVSLTGGNGGNGYPAEPGGLGATVVATLSVTPQETLFTEVAGDGQIAAVPGFGGGGAGGQNEDNAAGAGGGASDVRTCSTNAADPANPSGCAALGSLGSRLAVAGGGGGGGDQGANPGVSGGEGGGAGGPGAAGLPDNEGKGGLGGKAGGQNAGGEAGGNSSSGAAGGGLLGAGGEGGAGYEFVGGGGGGGGGGIHGGGGGGGGDEKTEVSVPAVGAGGGGGGGSSGVPTGVTRVASFAVEQTPPSTQPAATYTWTLPPPAAVTAAPQTLTSTTASLSGTVNPDGSVITGCEFSISPAPPSGASSPCAQQVGAGGTPVAVSAALSGLSPGTAYTVTLAAASAQGSSSGVPMTFTTLSSSSATNGATLSVTNLKLSPSRFKRGKRAAKLARAKPTPTATTISFTLSRAATAQLDFEVARTGVLVGRTCSVISKAHSKGTRCALYTALSHHLTVAAHAGANRIGFDGVLDGRVRLATGSYRLLLRATAGTASATAAQRPTFTLLG